jgi:HEAT repeat protein
MDMPGKSVTEQLAKELPKLQADRQILLIGALANRQDRAALPAVTTVAGSTNLEVRTAAMYALAYFGDTSCVELLVRAVESNTPEERKAAIFALKNVGGTGVDRTIVKYMQNSQPSVRSQLIQVLSERNAAGVVPALLGEAVNPDRKVRKAAFKALGRLAGEKDLPSLVKLLVKLEDDSSRREAERAVVAVSRKISETSKRADAVSAGLRSEQRVAVRCSLLRALGGIANSNALEMLSSALKETNPAVRDTAVRALAKWPNATAAEVLLEIYSNTQNQIHRLLSLRGFVRSLSLLAEDRPVEKTLKMYRQAINQARSPEEQKLVLSGLANVSDPGALAMVEPFLQVETVKAEAAVTMIKIAGAIVETHHDQAMMAMNKLLAVLEDEGLRKQAEEIILHIKGSEAFEDMMQEPKR